MIEVKSDKLYISKIKSLFSSLEQKFNLSFPRILIFKNLDPELASSSNIRKIDGFYTCSKDSDSLVNLFLIFCTIPCM